MKRLPVVDADGRLVGVVDHLTYHYDDTIAERHNLGTMSQR